MWKCPVCKREFSKVGQSHYCGQAESSIDDYIAAQTEEVQVILKKIRATILMAAPKAIEKISWRMPTFWQGENLIHFAAFKNHIGIYPGELSRLPFADRFAAYRTTKGAIQLPLDKPIDYQLIADLTKYRVSVVEQKLAATRVAASVRKP